MWCTFSQSLTPPLVHQRALLNILTSLLNTKRLVLTYPAVSPISFLPFLELLLLDSLLKTSTACMMIGKIKIELKLTNRMDEDWKWFQLSRGPGLTWWGPRGSLVKCTCTSRDGLLIRSHLVIIRLQIRNLFSKSWFPQNPLSLSRSRERYRTGNVNRW